jgi:PAS domain S-box-containing protein
VATSKDTTRGGTPPPLSGPDRRALLRVILPYALFAALWIWLSDTVLGLVVQDRATLVDLSVYKGFLFILVTSFLLHQLVGRNLREARNAAEEIRRSRGLVEALFEGTTDAIYVKDREGRYLLANAAALRLFGRKAEELLGRDDHAVLPPGEAERVAAEDRRAMESDAPRTFEERTTAGGGAPRTLLSTKGPVRDGEGRVAGCFSLSRDVTSWKELEEQLRQSQKMEALGRLAGGVAHDFNNLLTVMGGYAELGVARTAPDDPLHDHFRNIRAATESATSLTRQLLAFSRKQVMRPEPLELNDLVARMEKLLRRVVGGGVQIRTRPGAGAGPILADPSQVEQVLMNLVVNGRDAMPGGGTITIATEDFSLRETDPDSGTLLPTGEYVVLEVSDEGTGMDGETQRRIFEPFFTTKESDKGTGLGLSTVLGIVEQSGGAILVESEPGRGSTFRVFFPRWKGDRAEEGKGGARRPAGS